MAFASKSPWVIHYDGSSCNGCDIEVLATLCPGFDGERFGVVNTGNPKHADIFLVTGSVNEQNIGVVREIYDQMLEPKVVVACGICAMCTPRAAPCARSRSSTPWWPAWRSSTRSRRPWPLPRREREK